MAKIYYLLAFIFFQLVFGLNSNVYAQKQTVEQKEEEDFKDKIKDYGYECYATETKEKEAYRRCVKLYEKYYKDATEDEKFEWKQKLEKKISQADREAWVTNGCTDFDPVRIAAFRNSIPESCVPLGEMLEHIQKDSEAKIVYTKACGHEYVLAAVSKMKSDEAEGLRILNSYGCVTQGNVKDYNLKNPNYCSTERLIGCVRLGDMLKLEEDFDKAKALFKRACEGGLDWGCKKYDEKNSQSTMLLYASLFLIGLATFIVTKMMFEDSSQHKANEQLEEAEAKEDFGKHGIVLKYSRPIFKRYLSPIVGSMKIKKKIKEKYRRPLASGGLADVMTPEDFYSFKLFLIIGFPIVFLGLRSFLEADWPMSIIPIISVFGFFYPEMWIKGKKEVRQRNVILAMPFAVDMLALSVEAGLDFVAAMQKVVEKAKPSPLVDEFQTMVKEIKIGASRAEALRNMAWRIDLIQMTSFTATLIAADSVGASIGPILKNLSKEIRQKKSTEVEKKGATAATKILFPMLFLITPAVFIIVAGPIILELIAQ